LAEQLFTIFESQWKKPTKTKTDVIASLLSTAI